MSSYKALFKELVKELEIIAGNSMKVRRKDAVSNQGKIIQYLENSSGAKLSAEKLKTIQAEVEKQSIQPRADPELLKRLVKEEAVANERDVRHLSNVVAFLSSQRVYCDLLERYNPGISMKQEDKVRKTARRVGLDVPE
ncbi:unnamed protein product [Kuraishia capsulata CBS 1993]|uniref:ATP synthase assembly factor FMC1, mitochondrial n=1 Tax=Kuraishia capsulata CBS 1993 TaxID=1382522 RepID=W6MW77_9ASCO|nr:uncharacterized protein KUCA_T00002952001 [Kuraishia capsulata CBS 1993]CDK26975.1 unnamed protein product [Kuraishia capsulata CBS 1993]